jgi:hypothetical protein
MCSGILLAREREEDVARQRSLITREMITALLDLANKSPVNSLEAVFADWFILIRITGLRCAEYAQKTNQYLMSMNTLWANMSWNIHPNCFEILQQQGWSNLHPFFEGQSTWLSKKPQHCLLDTEKYKKWQSITLVADDAHPDICPVQAAYRIFTHAKRLDQSNSEPMPVFVNKHGIMKYLTGNKILDVLWSIARVVHPDLSEDKI